MRKVNIILVIDQAKENVLMCLRQKDPYKGLYNAVGGKLENNETFMESCYRELFEETGITQNDITLHPLMKSSYYQDLEDLFVAYGVLNKEVELVEEKNPLTWISLNEDFSDCSRFAGDGNLEHMFRVAKFYDFEPRKTK